MKGREIIARVEANEPLNRSYLRLALSFRAPGFSCRPGQFAMLKPADGSAPLLRRPLSIWDWRKRGGQQRLEFFYKVVGEGTRALAQLPLGSRVSLAAPLGSCFTSEAKRPVKILVSGGVGLPPMDYLLRSILRQEKRASVHLFHGERSADAHLALPWEKREKRAVLHRASEGGGRGFRGQVVAALEKWLGELLARGRFAPSQVQVFACGPNAMMKALLKLCGERGLPAQIAVENHMGCGRGVCLGCVLRKSGAAGDGDRWVRVCCEGPVFRGGEVELP